MHDDDRQIGRILTRREALAILGTGGAALIGSPAAAAGAAAAPFRLPNCVVRPQQTEGPYFLDVELDRSDVRSDPTDGSVCEGAPLSLTFEVSRIDAQGCRPLEGAVVDIWQCDAAGIYSGVRDFQGLFDTTGKQFLRGHRLTSSDGIARFTTIYPGWYPGRSVHIHFKIRTDPTSDSGHEFTSQVYFDESLTDRVFAEHPYAMHEGDRRRNEQDGIFRNGGHQLMLDVREGAGGLEARFDIGLQID